ncbi:MAG: AAA domain-containing protein [Clostridium sp.]|nr:AAA domain-containing protein [Clostridium sp.]
MDYRNKIVDILGNVVFLNKIDWYEPETYDYLKKTVLSLKNINDYINDKAFLNNVKKICMFLPEVKSLENAIDKLDEEALKEAYAKVLKLKQNQKYVDDINLYYDKLNNAAPKFTNRIINDCIGKNFKEFNKAWNFRKMQCLINRAHKISSGLIERFIKEEKNKEYVITEKLVSKSAWYRQIKGTTDSQKRNLYAWIQAVKKTGRSRSRFLYKYRDLAQKEMEQCRDSIPVWIMPVNKIIENIKLTKNLFDVIIFDESSQCDIFSICALFRAKRAVIVGDDRQISPQIIGFDQDKVNKRIERYLYEVPNRESLDLETSLYSTALRVFPERVVLKEHFRCLPQIIGFSNNLCYANEIIPLRYENKTMKFRLPINAVKVQNGAKDKTKNINLNEAKSIVQTIVDCCMDNRYKNMTMGVISLCGNDQAQLIESMLSEKLGKAEMIKRNLMCGDPYSFQGDERDIIFLSMVVADNVKFTALTREIDFRRFNVAVTRAKNQLWLFYSMSMENLNPDCVRTKLIKYCTEVSNKKYGTLIPQYFENNFLRDVYNSIKGIGYNIVYYENLNKYNIDFVIEGDNKIAAIICNGGKNKTKEDTKTIFERQLNLEQSGWLFITIDGSEFYENKAKIIDKVQERLNHYGIGIMKKLNIKEKSIEISIK